MGRMVLLTFIGLLMLCMPGWGTVSSGSEDNGADAVHIAQVELYVTSWCPHCHKAKKFLEDRGVSFAVYDVEDDPDAARRMRRLNPRGGVPVAVIGTEVIRGFAESVYARALQDAGMGGKSR